MFRNYLKTAWRSLTKNKLFSFINIISLAIGISASFVIGMMVYYEFTFDKFHPDGDRIYRVVVNLKMPEGMQHFGGVSTPLGKVIDKEIPGVETASPFFMFSPDRVKIASSNETFDFPKYTIFADKGYFKVFKYTWLAGNLETALTGPNKVVLTQRRAKKYFPKAAPREVLGRFITYNDSVNVQVTGVVKNFKQRTELVFQAFLSLPTAKQTHTGRRVYNENWNNFTTEAQLFVKLKENASLLQVQKQLKQLSNAHTSDVLKNKYGLTSRYVLQPLVNMHLDNRYARLSHTSATANKSVLWALGGIALFLLLLGCINFINLNTAQAVKRAKEIGIKKTLGSSRTQLIIQFLFETFLLVLAAAVLSLLFTGWLLTIFSEFIPAGLGLQLLTEPTIIGFIVVLLAVVTFLSGFYPAIVLSGFKPVAVLKNKITTGKGKAYFRKSLTVFQFVIAQVFIIATLLVAKQIRFMTTADMGFKTENVAYLKLPWYNNPMRKRVLFMNQLKRIPQVKEVSLGGAPPASYNIHTNMVSYYNGDKKIQLEINLLYGDTSYLNLYNIKLLAGRNIQRNTAREYVINKVLMKKLGFKNPRAAIGKYLEGDDGERYPIVGVMEDFNQRSLKAKIKPMAFIGNWSEDDFSQLNRIHFVFGKKVDLPHLVSQTKTIWQEVYPGKKFNLEFMDETIHNFYEQEQKTAKLLNWATGLAVLISCLGLLGIVLYTTERRTKEIGIRKVLGASVAQLNLLLCVEFISLVGLAFLVAVPIAWWGLTQWLKEFAYKTPLSWWIFLLSGVAMILLAVLIMSIRTLAASRQNPVKNLRTE